MYVLPKRCSPKVGRRVLLKTGKYPVTQFMNLLILHLASDLSLFGTDKYSLSADSTQTDGLHACLNFNLRIFCKSHTHLLCTSQSEHQEPGADTNRR